ncbi:hypothetical protein OY671_009602, partial [Metschnikowia pulcherrima]
GDLIEIEVADDGPGIPDDQSEEVLQPFVRSDNARSRDTPGMGLGLPIVHRAIRRPSRDHTSATRARLSRRCRGATISYSPAEQRKNHPLSLGTSPECKSRASSVLQELTVNELIGRVFSFEKTVFPDKGESFHKSAHHGQSPKASMISCADSRIVPEHILQAEPGESFVCRNAGNIVPPFATMNGG